MLDTTPPPDPAATETAHTLALAAIAAFPVRNPTAAAWAMKKIAADALHLETPT